MKFYYKSWQKRLAIAAPLFLGFLGGCSSGSSSNSNGGSSTQGSLAISYDGNLPINNIQVTKGSVQQIFVSLKNSSGVVGQQVTIASNNPNIASISPRSCTLSSGSKIKSSCAVTINGLEIGSTSLNISSSGYSTQTLPTVSSNSVTYGTFEVESSDGNFYAPAANSTYSISTNQVNINAGIFGSSGITESNYAILNFAVTNPHGTTLTPTIQQCSVTSAVNNRTCTVPAFSVSGTPSDPILFTGNIAGPVLAGIINPYSDVTISESPAAPIAGSVVISSQNSNKEVPYGMHSPIFVNWVNGEKTGKVTLKLHSSNPKVIEFYTYNESGIKLLSTDSISCDLISPTASTMNCGYGIETISNSGSSTITATVTTNTLNIESIESLTLTVSPQEPTIRSITFTNNSTKQPIWIGITQGGANAFTSPFPNGQAVNTTHDLTPGAVSWCGISNPRGACPTGSTCRPGGAKSGSSTAMFCFWDALTPLNGSYEMESNGGVAVVKISGSSIDPNGIIWSGNFFARTKCNESGVCEVGSCGDGLSVAKGGTGLACAPGTGASPGGVVTLGELTFQNNPSPDYYDVSIINGVNFALAFGPNQGQNPVSSANAYTCGIGGSSAVQGSWNPSSQSTIESSTGLPAANWIMSPGSSSIYPFNGSVESAQAKTYYSWVDGSSSAQKCSTQSDCTGGLVCGYHLNSTYSNESGINQGANSDYQQYCGNRVAWLTADTIGGFNESDSNNAAQYFNFNESWANPVTNYPIDPIRGNNAIYVTNLQLCTMNTFSSYQFPAPEGAAGNATLACGGVDWTSYNGGITRLNSGFELASTSINPNWVNNVLPTIGWLKQACPTCYSYPFDDPTSTFTCTPIPKSGNTAVYEATYTDLN